MDLYSVPRPSRIEEAYGTPERTALEIMRLAIRDHGSQIIREATEAQVRHLQGNDFTGRVLAVRAWFDDPRNIQYLPDPEATEYIKSPSDLVRTGQEDCDGITALAGSMLLSIGIPVQVLLFSATPYNPAGTPWTHVLLRAWPPQLGAPILVDPVAGSQLGVLRQAIIDGKACMMAFPRIDANFIDSFPIEVFGYSSRFYQAYNQGPWTQEVIQCTA